MPTIKFAAALVTISLLLIGAGCAPAGKPAAKEEKGGQGAATTVGDVDNDICKFFDADFVYSATGKPVVRVEPSPLNTVFACDYYFEYRDDFYTLPDGKKMPGGAHVLIVLDNLSVEKLKQGIEYLGGKVSTDPRIKADHWIVRRIKDNSIWGVHLVINPNRFVWTDSAEKGLTDDELIGFGAKMAEKMQGKLSFDIKKNSVVVARPEAEQPAGASQESTARKFFEAVAGGRTPEFLVMLGMSDSEKQAWKTNFQTVKSLKVVSVEPAFQEEWTASRQVFKFALEAQVTDQGLQFGWENGRNFRWLTLESKGGQWLVTEIANNP